MGECRFAEHAAQRRVEQGREPPVGALDRADGLIEQQRVLDLVTREGVDHEPLLVRGDHLLRGIFQIENALVDIDHAVDQRDLEVQSGLGDDTHRLAKTDNEREARLIDREQRRVADDRRDDREDDEHPARNTELHWLPPVVAGFLISSLSGSTGTTPLPDPPG